MPLCHFSLPSVKQTAVCHEDIVTANISHQHRQCVCAGGGKKNLIERLFYVKEIFVCVCVVEAEVKKT